MRRYFPIDSEVQVSLGSLIAGIWSTHSKDTSPPISLWHVPLRIECFSPFPWIQKLFSLIKREMVEGLTTDKLCLDHLPEALPKCNNQNSFIPSTLGHQGASQEKVVETYWGKAQLLSNSFLLNNQTKFSSIHRNNYIFPF